MPESISQSAARTLSLPAGPYIDVSEAIRILADLAPGKLPKTAIGKLAVEAAWEIERETVKIASALAVMERLRAWVEKREGDCLTCRPD